MRVNAFLSIAGYMEGAWRLPESDPFCGTDIDSFCELAQLAEAGGMDAVFIADSLSLWADVRRRPTGTFEPSVLAASILRATERIGVIITLSTTFNEPYNIARRLASLDLAGGGRIGWNIVTSASDEVARNFGLATMPDHGERYARCAEFVEVCLKLWESWGPEAIIGDKHGHWGRPSEVQPIDHVGSFFRVAGPLDVPRSPQVVPLLVQAGTSAEGIDLAARYADAVFVVHEDLSASRDHRMALLDRARDAGRTRPIAVLPGIIPVIADSAAEAQERLDHLESLVDVELGARAIEDRFGLASGSLAPDRPFDLALDLPPVSEENGNQALYRVLRGLAERGDLTVAQVVRHMNAARGHLTVVGTPDDVADRMAEWFDAGAADGFNVIFPTLPGSMQRFVDEVMPRLDRRGYLDRPAPGSAPATLRERYQAERPTPG